MNPKQAKAIVSSITFGWPLKQWDVRLVWVDGDLGGVVLCANPPHRDTGSQAGTGSRQVVCGLDLVLSLRGPEDLSYIIESAVTKWLNHEARESLKVNGRRVLDPHPPPKPPRPSEQWRTMAPTHAYCGGDWPNVQARAKAIERAFQAQWLARERYRRPIALDTICLGRSRWYLGGDVLPERPDVTYIDVQPDEHPADVAARLLAAEKLIGQEEARA